MVIKNFLSIISSVARYIQDTTDAASCSTNNHLKFHNKRWHACVSSACVSLQLAGEPPIRTDSNALFQWISALYHLLLFQPIDDDAERTIALYERDNTRLRGEPDKAPN